jgi:hypothetical protein
MTNLDRQNLLALSADTDIVINSSNPTSYPVITGAWHNSEGNWDGARGNPAYKFHVAAAGNVIISLKSMDSDAVVLDLFDSNGNRISRDDQWQATAIVGANLASGDYYVVVQNSWGGYGSFDLIFEGTVASNIELDTDRDGDPDSQDLNDDNDASLNEVDPEPLDWSVF